MILFKVPEQFCMEYEILQVPNEVTLNELILHEKQVNPGGILDEINCRVGCNKVTYGYNPSFLSLKQGDYYIVYNQQEILYIEASGSYSRITILNQKLITVTFGLADIESKLSDELFVRIHRSVIVNINCITKFIGNTVYLGKVTFPVGRKFKKLLMMRLNLVCGSKKNGPEEYPDN